MNALPLPEMLLLQHLERATGAGEYEAHLTVEVPNPRERERFHDWCTHHGIKAIVIELPNGAMMHQPMTRSYHRGTVQAIGREVVEWTQRLRAAGFSICRVKIEANAMNAGVPIDDETASLAPPGNYFEFHVKLRLPGDYQADTLAHICARHDAHLSRNALKHEPDGFSERFLTQRIYQHGREVAFAKFDALLDDLADHGFSIVNGQREYSIFDSNVQIDAGWIDEDESPQLSRNG